jgi:hypothetical protein
MAYEIIGETIKSATSLKLGEIFGSDVKRYKESVTTMKYPNFYISQINLEINPAGKDRLQLDYLINIRYRIASDIATISNLQQQLDEVGLKLCAELTELELERPTKTKNRYYVKDDNGYVQFFFNITVFAVPEKEEEPKLKKYKLNEEVI